MVAKTLSEEQERQLRLFSRSLPLRVRLDELVRALGDVEGLSCLDVGLDNGIMSYRLRQFGGEWKTVVRQARAQAPVQAMVGGEVFVLKDRSLPFENKSFNAIVLSDCLEWMSDDEAFIEECHRVLKPVGRLVLTVRQTRSWTLVSLARKLLGLTYDRKGMARPGYTESQLFNILKNGFDVLHARSFSRVFVELTDAFAEAAARPRAGRDDAFERRMRVYRIANVAFRLAFQLDMLLVFARGYNLIATAKRRAWVPRRTPVLADGRSISEAVLSPIGG